MSVHGIAPIQMQAPVLHHTELTNAPVSPFLQTIQVLPKNSLLTSALNTPCNLMSAKDPRSALHPLTQTVSGDGQQYWAPADPSGQHR